VIVTLIARQEAMLPLIVVLVLLVSQVDVIVHFILGVTIPTKNIGVRVELALVAVPLVPVNTHANLDGITAMEIVQMVAKAKHVL